ncbi:Serine/threonine/tyrosine-interacting-like protein 1 [Chytridiales sp. JEL 0842]|nr:Serine/threonine/tyrosine-interacting-like protein 1 [Chytridiales sp. JEL 0842]
MTGGDTTPFIPSPHYLSCDNADKDNCITSGVSPLSSSSSAMSTNLSHNHHFTPMQSHSPDSCLSNLPEAPSSMDLHNTIHFKRPRRKSTPDLRPSNLCIDQNRNVRNRKNGTPFSTRLQRSSLRSRSAYQPAGTRMMKMMTSGSTGGGGGGGGISGLSVCWTREEDTGMEIYEEDNEMGREDEEGEMDIDSKDGAEDADEEERGSRETPSLSPGGSPGSSSSSFCPSSTFDPERPTSGDIPPLQLNPASYVPPPTTTTATSRRRLSLSIDTSNIPPATSSTTFAQPTHNPLRRVSVPSLHPHLSKLSKPIEFPLPPLDSLNSPLCLPSPATPTASTPVPTSQPVPVLFPHSSLLHTYSSSSLLTPLLPTLLVGSSVLPTHPQAPSLLRSLGITHILNLALEIDCPPLPGLTYLKIPMQDNVEQPIDVPLRQSISFIRSALSQENTKVLVHCKEGKSRSVVVCVAYLMQEFKCGWKEGLEYVKERRGGVEPNLGFMVGLMKWERELGVGEGV